MQRDSREARSLHPRRHAPTPAPALGGLLGARQSGGRTRSGRASAAHPRGADHLLRAPQAGARGAGTRRRSELRALSCGGPSGVSARRSAVQATPIPRTEGRHARVTTRTSPPRAAPGAHPRLHPADLPSVGERHHAGARLRFRRRCPRLGSGHAHHRARACAGQCAGAYPGLCDIADQRRDHPRRRLSPPSPCRPHPGCQTGLPAR